MREQQTTYPHTQSHRDTSKGAPTLSALWSVSAQSSFQRSPHLAGRWGYGSCSLMHPLKEKAAFWLKLKFPQGHEEIERLSISYLAFTFTSLSLGKVDSQIPFSSLSNIKHWLKNISRIIHWAVCPPPHHLPHTSDLRYNYLHLKHKTQNGTLEFPVPATSYFF